MAMLKRNQSFSSLTSDLDITHEEAQDDLVFEISWEVARKVGGIYTVMRSKAPVTVAEYGDSYALIGPMWPHTAALEFEEIEPSPLTAQVLNHLLINRGVVAKFGRWLVKGYPRVFLLDITSSRSRLPELKAELMPGFAPADDSEVDEAVIFGYQTSWLLESFRTVLPDRKIIAHFHEWLVGVGLIVSARMNIKLARIFTTHATLLGRYLSAGGCDLYHKIDQFKPDLEAGNRGIYARHWIEKEAAHHATVFTTVSDITGFEAEFLLHKKPDLILPNGLETMRFTALHEFQNLHLKYKEVLNEFVLGHFSGSYTFDIDKTLYFFTAGRYEIVNKGVDLFLEALARLNHRLKEAKSPYTVVAFIIMPAPTSNYQVHSLTGQALMKDIRKSIDHILKNIGENLLQSTARGVMPDQNAILSSEDLVLLKRRVLAVRQRPSPPPIVTHNMKNEDDEILTYIRKVNLFNKTEDRVKVIFHPEFLTPTNPLIPLDYSDFVRGCHLGVFPSYYEPWGYTPAECTMMGVPSITSDQSGFGSFMINNLTAEDERESNGIFIIKRRTQSVEDSIEQLTSILYRFTLLDRRQRIELRNRTERLSPLLDWKNLGQYYIDARNLALERTYH